MINQLQKKVLILALHAGEIMMKSGAEIYRVEDTITRICHACKIPYVECFATTTGIFLSLDSGDKDADMHTFIKRIKNTQIDLEKISRINKFSRLFTTTDLSIDEGSEIIKEIAALKPYTFIIRLLGSILVSSFFCLMFNGGALDCICAFLVVSVTYIISTCIEKLQLNPFITIFLSCALSTITTLILVKIGLGENTSPIIIGSITIFLPGVAITNAARDLLSGDMLSGLARATEAFIAAIAIAGGVGLILKLSYLFGGISI
ncbi:threonine/serine exporter family protein [Anaerovorax odorimutans]|uniref:threonine/serine ThrE exporter family protein n=1 Tax=Anaerovorax odorimutans TaxID=109327 RepID=UPI00048665EF|nr:threonine/serine exporter family protein [Anaerovorax odorimutans]